MRNFFSTLLIGSLLNLASLTLIPQAQAEEYLIDSEKVHAFIEFKIKHLGFSWLYGRFNKMEGTFYYDEYDPSSAKISLSIDVASIDSNHAERDKHLRGKKFLQVKQFPTATFVSTSFEELEEGKAILTGDFSLHGVTRPITIDVEHIGHGDDPWGGYRRGFYGTTSFKPADYGIDMKILGPHSEVIYLELSVEGIRQSKNIP